jgi:hypothetical protein
MSTKLIHQQVFGDVDECNFVARIGRGEKLNALS